VQTVLLPEQQAERAVPRCSECDCCDCREYRANEYPLFHLSVSIRAEGIITPPYPQAALHAVP